MNRALVDRLAAATLYEGYVLYPYRPSVKSRQRWTFGGLYPQAWSDAQDGTDPWTLQAQVLIAGDPSTSRVQVIVRFLHPLDRTLAAASVEGGPLTAVDSLEVAGKRYQAWQEAVEREVDLGEFALADLLQRPRGMPFSFAGDASTEYLKSADGQVGGALVREQQAIDGLVEISASTSGESLTRLSVRVVNRTPLADAASCSRDAALMRAFASTHAILGVSGGAFVSMTDPPASTREAANGCNNVGVWPVLVGDAGTETDTLLCSPIILYDYPKLAPESPGDLFDGTEIDEILTLRILTLTDDEKRAGADTDDRVKALLSRTETLARDNLMSLHGMMRAVPQAVEGQPHA